MNTLEIQKTIDYIYLQIERINNDIYDYEESTGGGRNLELERVRREYYEELSLYLKLLELSIANEDE
jgi:hypothetical protein